MLNISNFLKGTFSFVMMMSTFYGQCQSIANQSYSDVCQQIITAEQETSEIESLAFKLVDEIGPRLTASPEFEKAGKWILSEFRKMGIRNWAESNGQFSRGWKNTGSRVRLIQPYIKEFSGLPMGWTKGTSGILKKEVVFIEASSTDFLDNSFLSPEQVKKSTKILQDKILIMQPPKSIKIDSSTYFTRLSDENFQPQNRRGSLSRAQVNDMVQKAASSIATLDSMLESVGVVAIMEPSSRSFGLIRGLGNMAGMSRKYAEPLPRVILSREDYNSIQRLVANHVKVEIELDIQSTFSTQPIPLINYLAEIRGSQYPAEVIMLGAHLDSWHWGNGATDNGAGVIVLIEAIRILKNLNLPLKRSVRLAFWAGEEQGLLGSQAWIKENKQNLKDVKIYLNLDAGSGRIRGISNQYNQALNEPLNAALRPLESLGLHSVSDHYAAGSDHNAFEEEKIPVINFRQDPLEYYTRTHHSNLDTYDHLVMKDLKQAASVIACLIYYLANTKSNFSTEN